MGLDLDNTDGQTPLDEDAKKLGLSQAELAFYDALETNDSAVKVLGAEVLKTIAREIADKVKKNATIDWTIRESARAKLMVLVRRTLTKYGYLYYGATTLTQTVLGYFIYGAMRE